MVSPPPFFHAVALGSGHSHEHLRIVAVALAYLALLIAVLLSGSPFSEPIVHCSPISPLLLQSQGS